MQAIKNLRKLCQKEKLFVWQGLTAKMTKYKSSILFRTLELLVPAVETDKKERCEVKLQIISQVIAPLLLWSLFILYHALGADVKAGHTMDAVFPPHRKSVYHLYILHRTRLAAFATGDASFVYMETFGTDDETYKQGVQDVGLQPRSTAFMHLPDLLLPKHVIGYRGNSTSGIRYLPMAEIIII